VRTEPPTTTSRACRVSVTGSWAVGDGLEDMCSHSDACWPVRLFPCEPWHVAFVLGTRQAQAGAAPRRWETACDAFGRDAEKNVTWQGRVVDQHARCYAMCFGGLE
jgi:hypothetical protein